MPHEPLRFLGRSGPLTPRPPVLPWNSLWQLSQVRPFWNPAPFMPGFEPTEMIWLGFGFVLTGAGRRRKEKDSRKRIYIHLVSIIIWPCLPRSLHHRRKHRLGKDKGSTPVPSHSLGGDVDLFQFAVRFSSFQPLLQEGDKERG